MICQGRSQDFFVGTHQIVTHERGRRKLQGGSAPPENSKFRVSEMLFFLRKFFTQLISFVENDTLFYTKTL